MSEEKPHNCMTEPSTSALFIDIIDNNKGGHNDLLFEIPGLLNMQECDLYYFALAVESYESKVDVILAVVQLLNYWNQKIEETEPGEIVYLPIDFPISTPAAYRWKSRGMRIYLCAMVGRRNLKGGMLILLIRETTIGLYNIFSLLPLIRLLLVRKNFYPLYHSRYTPKS